jgi:Ser/Thr protein kinase RdoA (MazF antagonist)
VNPPSADPVTHPYDALLPEVILDAVEQQGFRCSGELLALNSYENRVYRIGIEDGPPLAAKFYRPERWSDAQILEEHGFAAELHEHEIPAVAPLADANDATLHEHDGYRYTLFPWQPGRVAELNTDEHYRVLGRYLGRLHALGAARSFVHRPRLTPQTFGHEPVQYLLQESDQIPRHLTEAYRSLTEQLLTLIEQRFTDAAPVREIRLHGDCHLGNLLWIDEAPHIVDFDDCRSGPAVQDLWMLLSGERGEQEHQLATVLEGYTAFCSFDARELQLVEALRTLRLLHYSAWLAQRWSDPAFPQAFPWFGNDRYWEEQVLILREQQALLQEPPLQWSGGGGYF